MQNWKDGRRLSITKLWICTVFYCTSTGYIIVHTENIRESVPGTRTGTSEQRLLKTKGSCECFMYRVFSYSNYDRGTRIQNFVLHLQEFRASLASNCSSDPGLRRLCPCRRSQTPCRVGVKINISQMIHQPHSRYPSVVRLGGQSPT